jgi:hypothetical protein
MAEYGYETTPYRVDKRGGSFFVRQEWWGKDISSHATQEEADAACIDEARKAGCLQRFKLKKKEPRT